jgi:hypothetical protein
MVRRFVLGILLVGALAACSGASTRGSDARPNITRDYQLTGVTFAAQDGLTVSEGATLFPVADIVWRGDPPGPRIPQIGAMFRVAGNQAMTMIQGHRPVIVDIVLTRFHGQTERTQASIGGTYDIQFLMTVRDGQTGAVLQPQRLVVAVLPEPGGSAFFQLMQSGQTPKVRVTSFLAQTLRAQLQ